MSLIQMISSANLLESLSLARSLGLQHGKPGLSLNTLLVAFNLCVSIQRKNDTMVKSIHAVVPQDCMALLFSVYKSLGNLYNFSKHH